MYDDANNTARYPRDSALAELLVQYTEFCADTMINMLIRAEIGIRTPLKSDISTSGLWFLKHQT